MAEQPTNPAPHANRRVTRSSVRFIDAMMKAIVTVGGVGVIVAVTGILLYLTGNVLPLLTPGVARFEQTVKLAALSPKTTAPGGAGGAAASANVHTIEGGGSAPLILAVDEYRASATMLLRDGRLLWTTIDQTPVTVIKPGVDGVTGALGGKVITSATSISELGAFALGFSDGTIQLGELKYETEFVSELPKDAQSKKLARGERTALIGVEGEAGGWGVVERTPLDQYRVTKPIFTLQSPATPEWPEPAPGASTDAKPGKSVVRIDYRNSVLASYLLLMREDGVAALERVTFVRPLGGGKPRTKLESERVAYQPRADGGSVIPDWFFVNGDGSNALALWKDGRLDRYARRLKGGAISGDDEGLIFAETVQLVESGRTITAASMLLGARTLVIGDDRGHVFGCFASRQNTSSTPDGLKFVVAHEFSSVIPSPVTAIATAGRDRRFVAGHEDGSLIARHMTSHKVLGESLPTDLAGIDAKARAVTVAAFSPKMDGLYAISTAGVLRSYSLDAKYADASLSSLFTPVWYEGDEGPSSTWQSSAGEDTAEIKYSLTPLIFGTLKATVYAMLFAAPIAILAAIYTSELLHPRVRNRVKPIIETMASLPSVVLGFVAAMIIAPLARDILPGVLMGFFVVPVTTLAAAYFWQMIPIRFRSGLGSGMQLGLVSIVTVLGLTLAIGLSGPLEKALFKPSVNDQLVLAGAVKEVPREQWPEGLKAFASLSSEIAKPYREQGFYVAGGKLVKPEGSVTDPAIAEIIRRERLDEPSMRRWLDGNIGTPWAGWFLLMVPASFILVALVRGRWIDPWVLQFVPRTGLKAALSELAKFVLSLTASMVLAFVLANALVGLGVDSRESIFGSFSQRNTLVVAIVMGFAIIPIIYTISEDALSAVPGSLRSASLGCGATKWQTALRVVLPIAGSGIFSACMIGLGRAAGETMIVLMATGNTPTTSWNIFEGMRTLAANIAVELPEAPSGETHYRVLFMGGLCLFVMTFVINTVAEIIRQRFRKRSAAL